MAIQLPRYKRQVGASAQPTAQIANTTDMGAEILGAGVKLGGTAMKFAGEYGEKKKKEKAAEIEFAANVQKLKDEGDLAGYKKDKQLFDEFLELKKNEAKLKGVTDDQMFDKVIAPNLTEFQSAMGSKGYSEDVMDFIQRDWTHEQGMYQIKQGNEVVLNIITGSNLKKVEYATGLAESGDADAANEVLDGLSSTAPPEQVSRWREEVTIAGERASIKREKNEERQRVSGLTNDSMNDPSLTIDKIDKQLKGEESYWDVTNEDLKSARAYSKMILAERQNKFYDELYTPDSEYQGMTPNQKQDVIDDMHYNGTLSSKSWKAETKRLKEPTMMEIRPQDNKDYIKFQQELYAAAGNVEGQMAVLDNVTASTLPEEMRKNLYALQRDMMSPTGKTRQATIKYGLEVLDNAFYREPIVGESPWYTFGVGGISEESREDLDNRANAEARAEFQQWFLATPEVTEAQVSQKVYDIVAEKSKQYSLSQIPARLEEQALDAPEPEPEIDTNEDVMSRDEFIADFKLEEDREPSEDELEQLKTQGYWR